MKTNFFIAAAALLHFVALLQALVAQPVPAIPVSTTTAEPEQTYPVIVSFTRLTNATAYSAQITNSATNLTLAISSTSSNFSAPCVVGTNRFTLTASRPTGPAVATSTYVLAFTNQIRLSYSTNATSWFFSTNSFADWTDVSAMPSRPLMRLVLRTVTNAPPAMVWPQSVTVGWDANTETNLAGYRVYYGLASRSYSGFVETQNTNAVITNLNRGARYYLAVTARNTMGLESGYSNEVTYNTP